MNFFNNKFLISFLILTVAIYGFSVKQAEAKGVATFFTKVLIPIIVVAIVIVAFPELAPSLVNAAWIVGGAAAGITTIGQVACLAGSSNLAFTGCGSDNSQQQGAAGSPTLQNQTATPIVSSDGNCTTGFTLNYSVTDAYQYGIYRDGNLINQGTLNTVVQPSPYNASFLYTDSGLAPNKDYKYEVALFDKNGTQYRYPQLNAYSECIKLDLKINGSDGPAEVKVAYNDATLNWITEGATSCSASGDWSGSKGPATGSEDLGKLPRGTSNPGKGKQYNYSMSCNYPKNKTLSDSVSITVFKFPECNFSANPAVIEVLPATSTLSWDCDYADACSIDQEIGEVDKRVNGTAYFSRAYEV